MKRENDLSGILIFSNWFFKNKMLGIFMAKNIAFFCNENKTVFSESA